MGRRYCNSLIQSFDLFVKMNPLIRVSCITLFNVTRCRVFALRCAALKEFHPSHPMTVQDVKGDLFSSPATDSLAHCISEDIRMGAGIAVLFKKKFGGIKELKNQNKKTGEVAVLKVEDRYVYYLITKKKASDKPTYESLRKSLEAMKDHCLANNVSHISMPRIGCGLDKLEWPEVLNILEDVFAETDIMVTVYSL